jgi:hypothetical protein
MPTEYEFKERARQLVMLQIRIRGIDGDGTLPQAL